MRSRRQLLFLGMLAGALVVCGVLLWPSPSPTKATGTNVDFSLGIDGVCDTNGGDVKCGIPGNTDFDISVYLENMGEIGNDAYDSLGVRVDYGGAVSSNGRLSIGWWGCVMPTTGWGPGYESIACIFDPKSHTGLVVTGSFHCGEGQGTLALDHGPFDTFIVNTKGTTHYDKGSDTITVNCEAITPTPTKQPPPGDTDGDGCPDADENGPSETAGGRRDYLNPWDYFNPTNDGVNLVDDIVAVVDHYGLEDGQEGYDQKYDRTYVGPNPWNLGPPDGVILVADILHAVEQYGHDCGEGVVKPTPTITPTPTPT